MANKKPIIKEIINKILVLSDSIYKINGYESVISDIV